MKNTATVTHSSKVEPFTGTVTETARGWSAWRCTPWGWVDMRSAWPEGESAFTSLVFVWQGRRWERIFTRYTTPIGAARLATKFVKEVVEQQGEVQP